MCLQITGCKIHMCILRYIYINTYIYIYYMHRLYFIIQQISCLKNIHIQNPSFAQFGHLMLVGRGKSPLHLRWEAFLLGYLQHRCNLFPLNPLLEYIVYREN